MQFNLYPPFLLIDQGVHLYSLKKYVRNSHVINHGSTYRKIKAKTINPFHDLKLDKNVRSKEKKKFKDLLFKDGFDLKSKS